MHLRVLASNLHVSLQSWLHCFLIEGVYAVCLGNMMSRFSAKLVHFYLVSFLVEEWQKLSKDLEQFDVGVQNFTVRYN